MRSRPLLTAIASSLLAMPLAAMQSPSPEPAPKVETAPGFVTVLMHHTGSAERPVVWLKIPEQYVRARTNAVINRLGFIFFATYPDMKGPFTTENQGLLVCRGFCRGRMSIGVENRSGDSFSIAALATVLRNSYGTGPSSPAERFGIFDQAESDLVVRGPLTQRIDYYTKTDKAGHMSAFVVCRPSAAVPMCQERMQLDRHPDVWVTYAFSMSQLPEWVALRSAVAKLVDSFVVKTLPAGSGGKRTPQPVGRKTVA